MPSTCGPSPEVCYAQHGKCGLNTTTGKGSNKKIEFSNRTARKRRNRRANRKTRSRK